MTQSKARDASEAWKLLKGWHREAGNFVAKLYYQSIVAQTEEREDHYIFKPPPPRAPPLPAWIMFSSPTQHQRMRRSGKQSILSETGGRVAAPICERRTPRPS